MPLPAVFRCSRRDAASSGEVTRLNSDGQFKPFVYLNSLGIRPALSASSLRTQGPRNARKKNPALRRDFPALAWSGYELAIPVLIGILALTVRILLLLAGLMAT